MAFVNSSFQRTFSDSDYQFVWIYISPVILLFGLIGNVLILLVISRRPLTGSSTSVYLLAMATSDSAALLLRVVPEFLKTSGLLDFSELSQWTCKLEKFSFYAASDVAIWILAAFTADRLVAVGFPLSKRLVCTSRKAYAVCGLLVAVAISKNVHVFWTRGQVYDVTGQVIVSQCGRREQFIYFEEFVRPWMAFVLVSVLPSVVIVICNMYIVHTLTYVRRARKAHNVTKPVGGATSLMCIGASVTFLICVTPSIVLAVGRAYWSGRQGYVIARVVNNQLACLNHAINVLLYCLTGQRFRRELVNVLTSRWRSDAAVLSPNSVAVSTAGAASITVTGLGFGELSVLQRRQQIAVQRCRTRNDFSCDLRLDSCL
jgi:7 transmembrane receptor (rhodopsin family)